jgi:hypothetical protein
MKIEIRFTDEEAKRLQWLLQDRYKNKTSSLATLAKKAIREIAAQEAENFLIKISS